MLTIVMHPLRRTGEICLKFISEHGEYTEVLAYNSEYIPGIAVQMSDENVEKLKSFLLQEEKIPSSSPVS